jgi:hypothetical protein
MEIDINEFKERLAKEQAKGKSEAEIAAFIYHEIRTTEDMKAGLMEEMNEANKDFLNDAAARIDTYVFQLQEIEKDLNIKRLKPDQRTALQDEGVREKIAEEIEKLDKLDPEKYPETNSEASGKALE